MSYGIIGFLIGVGIVYTGAVIFGLVLFLETIENYLKIRFNEEVAKSTTIIMFCSGIILICTTHGYILELLKLIL